MRLRPAIFTRIIAVYVGMLAAVSLLTACTSRQDPAPTPLLPSQAEPVDVEGVRFQAQALENSQQAGAAFGFDIRGLGLLPLRVNIDNHGGGPVSIIPRQTFLIDSASQAWPLLTSAQALARLKRGGVQDKKLTRLPTSENLETLTGFALDLVVGEAFSTNTNADDHSGAIAAQRLAESYLRNPKIPPGRVVSGVLFFPGQGEAQGVVSLRLCYEQDGRIKFLSLPLKSPPPLLAPQ